MTTQRNGPSHRRILVIDDNEKIHDDFRRILASRPTDDSLAKAKMALLGDPSDTPLLEGFTVDSAFQGQQGLEMIRQAHAKNCPYAMAFVDVRMPPGWDGIETTSRIWKEFPHLQVVICTAYSDYSWEDITDRLGVGDRLFILKKPFDVIEARQLSAVLTERARIESELAEHQCHLEDLVNQRTRQLEEVNDERERDFHERERLEIELAQAQKLEAVGRLAAGIAHEINTPTQYIGDNTRFLQETFERIGGVLEQFDRLLQAGRTGQLNDELLEDVGNAVRQADLGFLTTETPRAIKESLDGVDRVSCIVRAMKEFSHPGSRQKQSIDINRAIESTLTVSRNEWKYIADLETDFDPSLPAIPCLPGDFNQVILNLVINAAHAIADVLATTQETKGTITVRTRLDGPWAEIRVTDTGAGIPKEIRDKVFDPFFTTKDIGRGTGQGLTIAYSTVVEKHGGTIRLETEEGKGTTFIIRLPVQEPAQKPRHQSAGAAD